LLLLLSLATAQYSSHPNNQDNDDYDQDGGYYVNYAEHHNHNGNGNGNGGSSTSSTSGSGSPGSKGDTGSAGTPGSKGDTGSAGSPGTAGVQGPTGAKGKSGLNGQAANKGVKGSVGPSGVGPTGAAGSQGIKGAKGASVPAGTTGNSGTLTITRARTYFSLVPPCVNLNTAFTAGQPSDSSLTFNFFSNIYVANAITSPPGRVFPLLSNNTRIFSAGCSSGTLVGGDCSWNLFSFNSATAIPCQAVDFTITAPPCTSCFTAKTAATNGTLLSLTAVNSSGISNTYTNPSCNLVTPVTLDNNARLGCGYFCFFYQVLPYYCQDTVFSCRYIPAEFQYPHNGLNYNANEFSPYTFNQSPFGNPGQINTNDWSQRLQVVTVETFCAN